MNSAVLVSAFLGGAIIALLFIGVIGAIHCDLTFEMGWRRWKPLRGLRVIPHHQVLLYDERTGDRWLSRTPAPEGAIPTHYRELPPAPKVIKK